jgi:uncharacterized protein YqeY
VRTLLRRDLLVAMTARDSIAVAALRSALAAIENAEAVEAIPSPQAARSQHIAGATPRRAAEVERRVLTAADERGLVQSQVDQPLMAAGEYEKLGRQGDADRLLAQADVLRSYLPPRA